MENGAFAVAGDAEGRGKRKFVPIIALGGRALSLIVRIIAPGPRAARQGETQDSRG
jgi:hypothetical protein